MTLNNVPEGSEVIVKNILVDDEEIKSFLFTLGCYSGEAVTVVTKKKSGIVLSIKDGRYNIDNELADLIETEE